MRATLEMFCPNLHAASFSLVAFKMASNTPLLTISKVQREIRMAPMKSPLDVHFVDYFLDTTLESMGLIGTADSWARYVFLRFHSLNVREFYGIDGCSCKNFTHGCNYVIDFFDALYDDSMSDEFLQQLKAFENMSLPQHPIPSDADLALENTLSKYPRDTYWCFTAEDFLSVQLSADTLPVLCKRMCSVPIPFDGPQSTIARNGIYVRERLHLRDILLNIHMEHNIPQLGRILLRNLFTYDYRKLQKISAIERECISGAIHAINLWTAIVSANGSNGLFYQLSRKYGSAFSLCARTTTNYFKRKMSPTQIRDELGMQGLGYIEITSPDLVEIRVPHFIDDIIADVKGFILEHFRAILAKPSKSKIYVRGDLALILNLPESLLVKNNRKPDQFIMFDTM